MIIEPLSRRRLIRLGQSHRLAGIAHEVKQPLYAITNCATAASVSLRNVEQSGSITAAWLERFDRLGRLRGAAMPDDGFVEVQIVDNGPGIASDQNGKLFEAFYTTKPSAMGMGLAISQTIVENHGGCLWGRANQHGGATFHFTLPKEQRTRSSHADWMSYADCRKPPSTHLRKNRRRVAC